VEDARDASTILMPEVKNGNVLAADYVLGQLHIKTSGGWGGSYANGNPIWGQAENNEQAVKLSESKLAERIMPDVTGMGASDAVYILESHGVKVRLKGTGHVKSQSVPYGSALHKGMICDLQLQ
jgi:cell division protein FtsI (penicillin-binding protein 3)